MFKHSPYKGSVTTDAPLHRDSCYARALRAQSQKLVSVTVRVVEAKSPFILELIVLATLPDSRVILAVHTDKLLLE